MPADGAIIIVGAALAIVALVVLFAVIGLGGRRPEAIELGGERGRTSWISGLAKTRGGLSRRLMEAWRGPGKEEEWLAEVEEILLTSDVGVGATQALLEGVRPRLREVASADGLRELLKAEVKRLVVDAVAREEPPQNPLRGKEGGPTVILVVGVNGVGKTTTIGKLAYRSRAEGKKVLLVAADTFRAAATEQLTKWAERVDVDLVKHQAGSDPSAVAFDGVKAGEARGADVVIIDTAGRLHVKSNLMEELKKIARTVGRQLPGAPHEVLLVIDATTGQNALNQARVFHEALPVTGIVLAKLDGTARGGIALAIRRELSLPIRYVGLGERPEDLVPFDADAFVNALFPDKELSEAS